MEIIENLLSPSHFNLVTQDVMNNDAFPWFRTLSTSHENDQPDIWSASWYHTVFRDLDRTPKSVLASTFFPVLAIGMDRCNLRLTSLMRVRLGMITTTPQTYVHAPHIDADEEHYTALYYLNDADGDTIFYDQLYKPGMPMNSQEYASKANMKVFAREKPTKNKFVLFNGLRYHSSSSPTQSAQRIVVNFNFRAKKIA